jgi:hypothetical protein
MKVVIDHLTIDVLPGERINPATLKVAIERELARRIEEQGLPRASSAPSKRLNAQGSSRPVAEKQRARGIAARICEGIGR